MLHETTDKFEDYIKRMKKVTNHKTESIKDKISVKKHLSPNTKVDGGRALLMSAGDSIDSVERDRINKRRTSILSMKNLLSDAESSSYKLHFQFGNINDTPRATFPESIKLGFSTLNTSGNRTWA